jgi:hypothetical protein
MANLITLYWRDIPAQVIAERGRGASVSRPRLNCHGAFQLPLMRQRCAMAQTRPMIILLNGDARNRRHVVKILTLKRQRMRRRLMRIYG